METSATGTPPTKSLSHFRAAIIATVADNDKFKDPKQIQLEQWCDAFLDTFYNCSWWSKEGNELEAITQQVLSYGDMWDKTTTIHGVKLNRGLVVKILLEYAKKKTTPLNNIELYQIACTYCVEDFITKHFKVISKEVGYSPRSAYTRNKVPHVLDFLKDVEDRGDIKQMTELWTANMAKKLKGILKIKDPSDFFVYGLENVFKWKTRVEAVEYFWNKIKINDVEVDETLFMNATVSALNSGIQCDVFEFCFSQLSPNKYRELLRRDYEKNLKHLSFEKLQDAYRFDLCKNLFDFMEPDDIPEKRYSYWITSMRLEYCRKYYLGAAVDLIKYMWMRRGFDKHRAFTLRRELRKVYPAEVLLPLVNAEPNVRVICMKLVSAILDETRYIEKGNELFQEFLKTKRAEDIIKKLQDDQESLTKFYRYTKRRLKLRDDPNKRIIPYTIE